MPQGSVIQVKIGQVPHPWPKADEVIFWAN